MRKFWNGFQTFWNTKSSDNIALSNKDIYLGNSNFKTILNYMILLAKNIILQCQATDSNAEFDKFHAALREKFQMEKYLAYKHNKKKDFQSKWTIQP